MSHRHQTIPPLLLMAAAAAIQGADDFGLQMHGFVSQGYLLTEGDNYLGPTTGGGTFDFNEFALNLTATPVDRLRLGVQIFARSIGNYGGDSPEIDWAYADYRFSETLGVTVGRFKITHGLYNEDRDLDMTRTEIFQPMTVYSTRLRDVYIAIDGAQVYASLPCASFGSLDAVLYIGGQSYDSSGSVAMEYENTGYFNSVDSVTVQRIIGGALTWNSPIEGLRARASLFDAHHLEVDGANDGTLVAAGGGPLGSNVLGNTAITSTMQDLWSGILSLEYQFHDLVVAGEYNREYGKVNAQNATSLYANVPGAGGTTTAVNLGSAYTAMTDYRRMEGAYLSASYRITQKCDLALVRSVGFADYQHRGLAFTRAWTVAARYDILDNWLVKAEWDFVQGTQEIFSMENPAGITRDWQIFALKTTVDF
jgi:hypothetical protein